jgi:eukaryotic-like serine/threonine-protein kinase
MPHTDTGEFITLQTALAGRYSLERELGRGGMGIVYLARDVALDRLVALKQLPSRLATEPALRDRFLREARTAAKLSHPNIVPIFAVEEAGDFVFFVMAYVDGETLGQRVRARGPMPPSELARVLREVAWGLAYAHAQGVVHRDVKADNILLERGSGRALVADFGIASVVQAPGATGVGEVLGTAEYMSPEQASGEAVDGRSDIYSLGVVAFYALSGRLPFEGHSLSAVLAKHITQPAPPIAEVCEGVPSRLAHAVDRCLAKDPAARFASGEDLADAVAVAIEARRELPVPLRVFIKKSRELTRTLGGVAFLELYFGSSMIAMLMSGVSELALGFGAILLMIATIPAVTLVSRVRALLKAGYGREELIVAWKTELEREREERAFEYGHAVSTTEGLLRGTAVAGLVAAVAEGLWMTLNGGWGILGRPVFVLGIGAMLMGGAISLLRHERRTNLVGRLLGKLWESRLGWQLFRLAGLWLRPSAIAAPATHRPTELALGMAVDALFEALPKPARRQLGDLPKIVRGLEDDAMKMRRRVNELDDSVAKIEATKRSESATQANVVHADRREALDRDLHAARDLARQRLADAVTALEGIRLNLLRLTAGTGSVDSLTADLAAVQEVSDGVRFLLAGEAEVERALKR